MKIVNSTNVQFKEAARNIAKSRKLSSEAKRLEESAKGFVAQELLEHEVNLSNLPIGSTIVIKLNESGDKKSNGRNNYEDCLRITVKPQNKIDSKQLNMEYPAIANACRREFPCLFYDSLVVEDGDQRDGASQNTLGDIKAELEERRKELQDTIRRIESLRSVGTGNFNRVNNKEVKASGASKVSTAQNK